MVLGDGAEQRFRTDDFFYLYRRLQQAFLRFQADWRPEATPDPGLDRSWGQWSEAAKALLQSRDRPSLTARITLAQLRRLEEAGTATLHALARLDGRAVPGITPPALERLVIQARLQVHLRLL